MRRIVIMLAIACGLSLGVSACNTVRGVGQDLESVATSVDRAT